MGKSRAKGKEHGAFQNDLERQERRKANPGGTPPRSGHN